MWGSGSRSYNHCFASQSKFPLGPSLGSVPPLFGHGDFGSGIIRCPFANCNCNLIKTTPIVFLYPNITPNWIKNMQTCNTFVNKWQSMLTMVKWQYFRVWSNLSISTKGKFSSFLLLHLQNGHFFFWTHQNWNYYMNVRIFSERSGIWSGHQ